MRNARKGGAVIEAVLILIGAGLLAMACADGASAYRATSFADHADGVIKAITSHGLGADVEYIGPGDATVIFSQSGLFFNSQIGQHVPVVYNADNPTAASVNLLSVMWFKAVEAAAPGVILLFIGFKMRSARNL